MRPPPRGYYAQSTDSATSGCLNNPACYATAPGEEAIIPWLSRAVEAARALATLKEFLEEADLRLIERILVECAKKADFQVNEREYGEGNSYQGSMHPRFQVSLYARQQEQPTRPPEFRGS